LIDIHLKEPALIRLNVPNHAETNLFFKYSVLMQLFREFYSTFSKKHLGIDLGFMFHTLDTHECTHMRTHTRTHTDSRNGARFTQGGKNMLRDQLPMVI